jgi:hypothetical protein
VECKEKKLQSIIMLSEFVELPDSKFSEKDMQDKRMGRINCLNQYLQDLGSDRIIRNLINLSIQ